MRFVVTVFPKIVSVSALVRFAYILAPIDNVSVGAKLDIPEGAAPVVRKAFIFTLLFITTGVSVRGSIVSKFPTEIPPGPTFSARVYVLPWTTKTFDPVSSTKRLEPTHRSWVGNIFATPTAFEVYISPNT